MHTGSRVERIGNPLTVLPLGSLGTVTQIEPTLQVQWDDWEPGFTSGYPGDDALWVREIQCSFAALSPLPVVATLVVEPAVASLVDLKAANQQWTSFRGSQKLRAVGGLCDRHCRTQESARVEALV